MGKTTTTRSVLLAALLVAIFLWSYEVFALWDRPWITAWIIIGYFVAAFAVDSFFQDASFCKYVCPIGQFNFVASTVSPLEVAVRDNQAVKAGDILVRIDDRDYRARVDQAAAGIAMHQASLDNLSKRIDLQRAVVEQAIAALHGVEADANRAARDFTRAQELSKAGWTSQSISDQAEADHLRSRARRAEANANLAAAKRQMEKARLSGTIVIWPGIAEEVVGTKAYYIRSGLFKDVDVVLYNHVGSDLVTSWGEGAGNGLVSVEYTFKGESAHSAGAPWRGKSALDAVELMNIGWNYRREHLPLSHRSHYVVTRGGDQPNVVPPTASVCMTFTVGVVRGITIVTGMPSRVP